MGLFVFLVLSCMSCLYILEINSLSVASFPVIFSHSEGCLFTLLIVFFDVQKLLRLIRSHLFILIISLLVIIIFLFLPHKHFNCYTIVCTSDFQNVNIGCNASTNPSGWVLSVYCTSIRLSIFLSMNYFIIPENQKLSPSKKGN